MENRKHLIIVRGIPGSGKSTFSQKLMEKIPNSIHIESDMYFMKNGKYDFDGSKLYAAHKWCNSKAFSYFDVYDTVIVSNTFTTMHELRQYISKANDLGIDVIVVRMKNNFKNVHDVPANVLLNMQQRFALYDDELVCDEKNENAIINEIRKLIQ